jgi:signal transduction histidine kinase
MKLRSSITSGKSATRRRPGLHQEILLTLVFLLGAALLLGGVLFLRYAEQSLLEGHIKHLLLTTRLSARDIVHGGEMRVDNQSMQLLQTELTADSWWLLDRDFNLLSSVSEGILTPVAPGRLRGMLHQQEELVDLNWPGLLGLFAEKDERLGATVATPVGPSSSTQGILVVHYSLEPIRERLLKALKWVFFYAFGYGLVLAAAGFVLLRRNIIQPVKSLLAATEKVTNGNLDPLQISNAPNEISELADSFIAMTTSLRQSREKTEDYIRSLKDTNDALKRTQEELVRSEKLATVGYLAAGMAHEIGNPLGALIGYLDILQSDLPEGTEKELVMQAAKESERIDRLVRDLLDYASPGDIESLPVDPWVVVYETLEMLNAQGTFKGVQLEYDFCQGVPPVSIDRYKLSQVLVNLLLNARDSFSTGGRIRVVGKCEGRQVVLEVEDDGDGMSPDVQRKIFEPFFTTKAPGKGRGLGLAVCQRVITEAGGEIRVSSEPGKGSCFSLLLPIAGGVDD